MSNNIKLKDLVWKEIDHNTELEGLQRKWYKQWEKIFETDIQTRPIIFCINNAEQIAKEKAKILNKKYEYTKQDIIDMFVEARFEWDGEVDLIYKINRLSLSIKVYEKEMYLSFKDPKSNGTIVTHSFELNDRKSIEFYYAKFREILEFEVSND